MRLKVYHILEALDALAFETPSDMELNRLAHELAGELRTICEEDAPMLCENDVIVEFE